jgi:hypothetical protein
MNTMQIATLGAGVSLAGMGLMMRNQRKPWKAFFVGGLGMLVLAALSLFLGIPL